MKSQNKIGISTYTYMVLACLCIGKAAGQVKVIFDNTALRMPQTVQLHEDGSVATIPLQFSMEMSPSSIDMLIIDAGRVLPMKLNDGISLIFAANDSVRLKYEPGEDAYSIEGGKYSEVNYLAYDRIKSLALPYHVYDVGSDNFETYKDSVFFNEKQRTYILNAIDGGAPAPDVIRYLRAYIEYSKSFALLMRLTPTTINHFDELINSGLISKNLFNLDTWSSMDMYQLSSMSYCTLTSEGHGVDFLATLNNAVSNFSGATRDNLLCLMFNNEYLLRRLSESDLRKAYELSLTLEGSERAKVIMAKNYRMIMTQGREIPANVAAKSMLQAIDGSELTVSDLLNGAKGKTILIDFWASWCGPCIAGIPTMKRLEAQYQKHDDRKIIYISLDQQDDRWKASAKKHDILENQYLLIDGFDSALAEYLQLLSIPRYVTVAQDGSIKDTDASLTELEKQ